MYVEKEGERERERKGKVSQYMKLSALFLVKFHSNDSYLVVHFCLITRGTSRQKE